MALSCDSCEVGPLRDADGEVLDSEVVLLVVLPLGPDVPLFPFPLSWLLLPGTKLLGLGRPTLLTLSQLTERLRPVLPRVRGGGGFNGTVGEVLLLEPILEPIPPLECSHWWKCLSLSSPDLPPCASSSVLWGHDKVLNSASV